MEKRKLRDLYGERFGCSAQEFEERVLWRCFYPHARGLARALWAVRRGYFGRDLEILKQAGVARSLEQLAAEVKTFGSDFSSGGLLRRGLRVRVSRQRLLDLGAELFGEEAHAQDAKPGGVAAADLLD